MYVVRFILNGVLFTQNYKASSFFQAGLIFNSFNPYADLCSIKKVGA